MLYYLYIFHAMIFLLLDKNKINDDVIIPNLRIWQPLDWPKTVSPQNWRDGKNPKKAQTQNLTPRPKLKIQTQNVVRNLTTKVLGSYKKDGERKCILALFCCQTVDGSNVSCQTFHPIHIHFNS